MLYYIRDVEENTNSIKSPGGSFSSVDKFNFFRDTSHAFGRSALLLSGGASLGMYHFGVIKALWERKLLPRIISGASAGSIVACLVGVMKDEEMHIAFEPGSIRLDTFRRRPPGGAFARRIKRLFTEGCLMDIQVLQETI